jgi:hypothetical protein
MRGTTHLDHAGGGAAGAEKPRGRKSSEPPSDSTVAAGAATGAARASCGTGPAGGGGCSGGGQSPTSSPPRAVGCSSGRGEENLLLGFPRPPARGSCICRACALCAAWNVPPLSRLTRLDQQDPDTRLDDSRSRRPPPLGTDVP